MTEITTLFSSSLCDDSGKINPRRVGVKKIAPIKNDLLELGIVVRIKTTAFCLKNTKNTGVHEPCLLCMHECAAGSTNNRLS